ncbi:hypothetical protein [Halovulum sp. GXIMD14793]
MSENAIWVSDAISDVQLMKGYWFDLPDTKKERTLTVLREHKQMRPASCEFFPKEIYAEHAEDNIGDSQHIFSASGFLCISEPCAEILRQFDLGGTKLCEVKVFQNDRQTQVGNRHFFLNFDS